MAGDSLRHKKKGENAAPSSATSSPDNKRKKDGPSASRAMADVSRVCHTQVTPSPPQSTPTDLNIKQIATEVANLINPTIEAALDKAINRIQTDIQGLAAKLTSQSDNIAEMEERVSSLEDNASSSNNKLFYLEKKIKELENKNEDLENRSR
ncbi:hypothetical protein XELAEV_18002671mg, partial [Xenopus laevis]